MCGIIGYTGILDAKQVLTGGLTALEYRGYDSAGISFCANDTIQTIKTKGKVAALCNKVTKEAAETETHCGIGHTRWATHGGVSDTNSHPHTAGRVTLIHNGIIENYQELQEELAELGEMPVSQTDSEIAAMVINHYYHENPIEAIQEAVKRLEGAYAFCILFEEEPETIYCIRNGSPLVATHTEEGSVIASDMVALIPYSHDYFVLPEHHIAILRADSIELMTLQEDLIAPKYLHVDWDMTAAQKGGYDYFMQKEIHEQPEAIRNTIMPRLVDGLPDFSVDSVPDSVFENVNRIIITACGTAMHAGMIGRVLLEKYARIPVTVAIASEFRYENPILDANTLVITISQSGETADTLAALRLSKEQGARTLSIVNVKGSSIARESDYVLYTHAGPEIAVASTKAYTVQLSVMYLLAYRMGLLTGHLSKEETVVRCNALQQDVIPAVEFMLQKSEEYKKIGSYLLEATNLFYIGRGFDYALACEGSIKLKEISYIHSEAYAAGELKHGTISLITDNVPVIAFATQKKVYAKMISNVQEVHSRGASVILITRANEECDSSLYDYRITLPEMDDEIAPFAAAIALQAIAFYASEARGLDVDQPRNLAKSVTVE